MKDINKDIDHDRQELEAETIEQTDREASVAKAPAETLTGLFSKLAAIYHGVSEDELIVAEDESPGPDNPLSESDSMAESAEESKSDSFSVFNNHAEADSLISPADSDVEAAINTETYEYPLDTSEETYEYPLDTSEETHEYPVDIKVNQPLDTDDFEADKHDAMSRRQSRKEREEQMLFLDEEEARLQIKRQLRQRERQTLTSSIPSINAGRNQEEFQETEPILPKSLHSTFRPTTSSRKPLLLILTIVSALIIMLTLAFFIVRNFPRTSKQVEVSYQSTLENLDYLTANRIYILNREDKTDYHDNAIDLLRERENAIVERYIGGQLSYDAAFDELSTLALFMPLWPEESRSLHNSLALNSQSTKIIPTEVLSDSFARIDQFKVQERDFRIGQQLLNMDMNAAAIPYLRNAAAGSDSLSETARDQLRRSESTYLVNAVNSAQSYKANGDILRARLILESAAIILENNSEISNLLESLPPVDQNKLLLDISAMAMTYFDAELYHESLLIIDVGRNFFNELIDLIESGASLETFSARIEDERLDIVYANQGDEGLRVTLADSLRQDIESLDQLEIQLRLNIVTELQAKATQLADQGKYREARDTMDIALEFEPDDEQLMQLRTEYHNKTRLRINSFISESTARGFKLEKLKEITNQKAVILQDVTRMLSSPYAPALQLKTLPHRHNRFQGVFYLMDLGDAVNAQIVVRQGSSEIYRSSPLNEQNSEVSFDFSYDFTKEMSIHLLGSSSGSATRFNPVSGITMVLDAYFYNDGTWDETNATKLHAQHLNNIDQANKELELRLSKALKIDLYDELLNDSMWNSIFGHDALELLAADSSGTDRSKVVVIEGKRTLQVKASGNYMRGQMYFSEKSAMADSLVLMIEDELGNRWFSDVISEDQAVVNLDLPVVGNFNMILLTADGERVRQSSYQVLIKAQLYDFDQAVDPEATVIDGIGPTGSTLQPIDSSEDMRDPDGGVGN